MSKNNGNIGHFLHLNWLILTVDIENDACVFPGYQLIFPFAYLVILFNVFALILSIFLGSWSIFILFFHH